MSKKIKKSASKRNKDKRQKVVTVKVVKESKKVKNNKPLSTRTDLNALTDEIKTSLIREIELDEEFSSNTNLLEKSLPEDYAEELKNLKLSNAKKNKHKKHSKAEKKTSRQKSPSEESIHNRTNDEDRNIQELESGKKVAKSYEITEAKKSRDIKRKSFTKKPAGSIPQVKHKTIERLKEKWTYLLFEWDREWEFAGGQISKVDEKLYELQQKAIKNELKINQSFFRKEEVKIDGINIQLPNSISSSISEDIIFERTLFSEDEISRKRENALKELGWSTNVKRQSWLHLLQNLVEKYIVNKKINKLYISPDSLYFEEHQQKARGPGFYLPFKFLSRADYFLDLVVNRFLTLKHIQFRDLFEKGYFQYLRKVEFKKQTEIFSKIGKSWLGDYFDEPFYEKRMKGSEFSLRVIPKPLVHFALKNKKVMKKICESINFFRFPWAYFELKPFKYQSLSVEPISPTFVDQEVSLLHERPQIPPYWKTIREKAKYFSSSLYKEFLENFGEYDLLNYGKDSWEIVKSLRDRYFENHLSNEELSLQANQEIAPELNKMMKLLNEQPFLVFPLGASPAMYSILPELDGITSELSRHRITPDKRKKVSIKDVHIRSPRGIPSNILSNTEHSLSFSSDDCENIETKEFSRLKKFRDFEVDEYSKTCYSRFSQSMLLNCSRLKKIKELQFFKLKLPIWTFLNEMFLLDNDGLNPEGYLPYFERKVLKEDYKKGSFNHSLMYWEREFKKSKHLDSSIRHNRKKNILAVKLSLLELKLS